MRVTSLGAAAAAGVLGALPKLVFAETLVAAAPASGMPAAQSVAPATAPVVGEAYAAPFVVYVNSPQVGQAVIYVGEREIPISDPAIVQYLRQAAVGAEHAPAQRATCSSNRVRPPSHPITTE
ncbi:MAG: hypothetical protein ACR2IK_21930 [Chloroflexota bacterium]